jgi:hypothetical protein
VPVVYEDRAKLWKGGLGLESDIGVWIFGMIPHLSNLTIACVFYDPANRCNDQSSRWLVLIIPSFIPNRRSHAA